MGDPLLDEIVRKYLGEKIKHQNILNQNGANLVYLHGQDMARQLNLPDDICQNITPYPATHIVVNSAASPEPVPQPQPPITQRPPPQPDEPAKQPGLPEPDKPSLVRRLAPWVAAAALAGGGGLGGYEINKYLSIEKDTTIIAPDKEGKVGVTIE